MVAWLDEVLDLDLALRGPRKKPVIHDWEKREAALRAEAKALGFVVRRKKSNRSKTEILEIARLDLILIKRLWRELYGASDSEWALEIAAERWKPAPKSKAQWKISPESVERYRRRSSRDRHRL
jgi:hypothetical protein